MEYQKRYDVSMLKKRLSQYKELEREIECEQERLDNIETKMYTIGSPELSDMPRATTVIGDRIGGLVARKEELSGTLNSLIQQQKEERLWIEGILRNLKKADERAVIRMRYIDFESWDRVAYMLFGSCEDYPSKMESYVRRTTRLNGTALVNMVNYLNGGSE